MKSLIAIACLFSIHTACHAQEPQRPDFDFCETKFKIKGNGIYFKDDHACLSGPIDKTISQDIRNRKKAVRFLLIDSQGGDVEAAIKVGYRLFADKTHIFIRNTCFSSCANYIVPAAVKVTVLEKSFIAMHGSVPRTFADYRTMRRSYAASEDDLASGWQKMQSGLLKKERQYFSEIGIDERYIIDYKYKIDKFRKNVQLKCDKWNETIWLIDQDHLNAYGIRNMFLDGQNAYENIAADLVERFYGKNILVGRDAQRISPERFIGRQCTPIQPVPDDDADAVF